MSSLTFVLCVTCLFMGKSAQEIDLKAPSLLHQVKGLISVNTGENVTLRCFFEGDDSAWLFWYKQTLGQKPKLISSFYVYDTKIKFHDEFKDNGRFKLEATEGTNHLHVLNLDVSDSATYYCANSYSFVLSFAEGIIVSVRDPNVNVPALVHQSMTGSLHPGGSVTLNCTVHTGICDGKHSVYWFKDSGQTPPGIIYTQGDRNDQCERKPDTQDYYTSTCVYNLPLNSLSLSHVGTYYCAVVSCGQIVFGNGTDIHIKHEVNSPSSLVYYLSGALTSSILMVVVLALSVYKFKKNNCHRTECQARSAPFTTTPQGCEDNVHYAALSVNLPNRSRKQRSTTKTECVYSSVKR